MPSCEPCIAIYPSSGIHLYSTHTEVSCKLACAVKSKQPRTCSSEIGVWFGCYIHTDSSVFARIVCRYARGSECLGTQRAEALEGGGVDPCYLELSSLAVLVPAALIIGACFPSDVDGAGCCCCALGLTPHINTVSKISLLKSSFCNRLFCFWCFWVVVFKNPLYKVPP